VTRIWPVLVTYGDILPAEPLLAYIATAANGVLEQDPIRPLTLLGLEDIETIASMVANGDVLPEILAEKNAGAYRSLPFSRWVTDTRPQTPPPLAVLKQRWFDLTDGLVALLQKSD